MKIALKTLIRMISILKNDKEKISLPLLNMIKTDVYAIINNYFEVCPEDINLVQSVNDDGFYDFDIKIKASRIKKVNFLNI